MRRHAAALTCLAALLTIECGASRQAWLWDLHPQSQAGILPAMRQKIIAEAPPPEVILMGSSRMRDAVLPRRLEAALGLDAGGVLNLGVTSGTPSDGLWLYRHDHAKLSRARALVINLDDWYGNAGLPPNDQDRRYATLWQRLSEFEGLSRLELLVGWAWRTYDARGPLRQLVAMPLRGAPPPLRISEDGRVMWRRSIPRYGDPERSSAQDVAALYAGWRWGEGRWTQLERLKAAAEADGLKVLLVRIPWRPDYIAHAEAEHPEAVAAWRARFEAVGARMPEAAVELGLEPRDFYDYGHLALAGAEKYTDALALALRPSL